MGINLYPWYPDFLNPIANHILNHAVCVCQGFGPARLVFEARVNVAAFRNAALVPNITIGGSMTSPWMVGGRGQSQAWMNAEGDDL
jgi:hypothetical protein